VEALQSRIAFAGLRLPEKDLDVSGLFHLSLMRAFKAVLSRGKAVCGGETNPEFREFKDDAHRIFQEHKSSFIRALLGTGRAVPCPNACGSSDISLRSVPACPCGGSSILLGQEPEPDYLEVTGGEL